jgi:hypothetical protein
MADEPKLKTGLDDTLTDKQFRVWANRIITAICSYYIAYGVVLLALSWGGAR